MSDRDGSADTIAGQEPYESGRIGTKYLDALCPRQLYTGVMSLGPLRVLAVVVVLLGLLAAPLVAAGRPQAAALATANDADPAPGAHLAGAVGTQDSEVRGVVAAETFQARLANASSDRERATVIDDRLTAAERRLDRVEARLRTLERARENGSIDADAYVARLAALGATADDLGEVARASERAAADLPAERRASLNASERAVAIETRADAIREQTGGATDAIDGAGEEIRAQPISVADVRAVAQETIRVPDSLRGVAGSERVNLHIQRANGTTAVFAVDIENGRVVSVSEDAFENPSLVVYTDYRVIGEIRRADDPVPVVESAVADDRIRYDGRGLVNSLKYGLVKLAT